MQVDNPLDDVGRAKPPTLGRRAPLTNDVAGDDGQVLILHPVLGEEASRLAEIRARVLSGAYDSLQMAEEVARAILRSEAVSVSLYE